MSLQSSKLHFSSIWFEPHFEPSRKCTCTIRAKGNASCRRSEHEINERLVAKETVVLRRWGSKTSKFASDKGLALETSASLSLQGRPGLSTYFSKF